MAPSDGSTDDDAISALTVDFSETARTLFSAGTVDDTLAQVLGLVVATIEGCDFAGIVLVDGDGVTNAALTDIVVADLNALQHHCGEGPCLDAIAQNVTFYAADLAEDVRWSRFGPKCHRGRRPQPAGFAALR
jgi:hypothetical protein